MNFTPVSPRELQRLEDAMVKNAFWNKAMTMNPKDTTFTGTTDIISDADNEVINAVKSVPCHYA